MNPISGSAPISASVGGSGDVANGEPAATTSTYGIVDELARLERRVRDRERDEADVELAALDRLLDLLVVELADHDVDAGPRGGEAAHHGGEEARAGRLERADAQRADLARLQRVQVGLRGLQPRDDRVGVPEQQLARLGERDRPRAAGPLDELLADDPLERRDLLADRRLRVAEPLGRASERALARERLQGGEVPELDAEPSIRFHDRISAL